MIFPKYIFPIKVTGNSVINFLLIISIFLTSCSNTKYLKSGELLYIGADVKVESGKSVKGRKSVVNKVEKVIRPKPNKKVLGMRIGLWFYNVAGEPKRKGFKYFVKNKLGQKPVLFTDVYPDRVRDQMDATLFNNGYFGSYSNFELKTRGKKISVNYQLFLTEPYLLDSIVYEDGDHVILTTIKESLPKSILNKNDIYSLDAIIAEKNRIDAFLKTRGFFYFNPDYLIFNADTTGGNRKVNLNLKIKEVTPYEALIVYRINDVHINTAYSVGTDSVPYVQDTVAGNPYYFHTVNNDFRKRALVRSVFFKKEEIYSRRDHNATLGQLMGMGTFKFVNVRFADADSISFGFLDTYINLTPLPRRSTQLELELKSKSSSYIGPGINLSYRNRNIFRGAELFVFNLHSSFETQFGGNAKGFNSWEVGPGVELYLPRFITPFKIGNPAGYYVPKTKITASYKYLSRINYFNLASMNFSFGYKWKESQIKDHELNPVVVNFIRVSNKSAEFEQLLQSNALLQKSFEEQFFAGMNYIYTYNQLLIPGKRNQFFFIGKAELSGNAISLINGLVQDREPNPETPFKIGGEVYAQFAKAEADFRLFHNISDLAQLVTRMYAGAGRPYGNSLTLPYMSQFFSGGASSVRAFRVRSLGPGTYRNDSLQSSFYDQGGELKFEANVEHRYKIAGLFRGAFFIDGGNIWLLEENPSTPGGKISKEFINEIAIGGGLGLRLDADFFVLRLDLAIPFRKPWLPSNDRWVFDKINFGSSSWRRENLILNIAIGYPF